MGSRRPGLGSFVRVATAGVPLLAILSVAGPALAHGGEGDVPAKTFVEQAIAIIRSQPDQVAAIEDKIADALEAEDTEGVDLELVTHAQHAFETGDLALTEQNLELAIGLNPGDPVVTPNEEPRQQPLPTAGAGPRNHLRELPGVPIRGSQRVVLPALAAVLAAAGIGLARKYR